MKFNFPAHPFPARLLFLLLMTGLSFNVFGQSPQPIIFKALPPPMTSLFYLDDINLVGIANRQEIQLWDANSRAYFGNIVVVPPEFTYCRIHHIEYLKKQNKIAVAWENITIKPGTKDTVYIDNLSLVNLATLLPDTGAFIYGNGMARLLKIKYAGDPVLENLKEENLIYRYSYQEESGSLFTIDRSGKMHVYRQGAWQNSFVTGARLCQLLFPVKKDNRIFLSDKLSGELLELNTVTGVRIKSYQFEFIPNQADKISGLPEKNLISFSANPNDNKIWIADSINKFRTLNTETGEMDSLIFPSFHGIHILSVIFNPADSSIFGIAEQQSPPYSRYSCYSNLKTGITNYFTGGTTPFISYSYSSGLNSKFRMMISGLNEVEVDLENLTERTVSQFYNSTGEHYIWPGTWENGSVQLVTSSSGDMKIKVHRSDSTGSRLLYQQNIRMKPEEQLAGIFPNKKWYILVSPVAGVNQNRLRFVDSAGLEIKSITAIMPAQTLNTTTTRWQHLFSKDGRYFMLKEILSQSSPLDSCRLRIFSTEDLEPVFDHVYTEHTDFNPFNHKTALFADSSQGFFFIATDKDAGGNIINRLHHYSLLDGRVEKKNETILCLDNTCSIPAQVRNIQLSSNGKAVLWFGFVAAQSATRQEGYQFVLITDVETGGHLRGMNIPPVPELIKALPIREYFGLQFLDRIDFIHPTPQRTDHFLSIIPFINDNNYELSNVYLSPDYENNQVWYYEKTNNNDCISFKWGNRSFRRKQFDINFNRPDRVLAKIPGHDTTFRKLYSQAVLKRSGRIAVSSKQVSPAEIPELRLVETYYSKNGKFTLVVKIHSKSPLHHFYLSINGNKTEKKIEAKQNAAPTDTDQTWRFSETLTFGDNIIELTAVTETGVESLPLRLSQNHSKTFAKPNLHLLSVSVGRYHGGLSQLPFAVKDGRDMTQLFHEISRDTFYNKVILDSLFDETAEPAAIESWINNLEDLAPSDYVIIFFSGHGFLDSNLNLRLATSYTDINDPDKKSIDYEQIVRLMDELPARQKLLLVDACHSGDFDKTSYTNKTEPSQELPADSVANSKGIKRKNRKVTDQDNSFEIMQNLFSFSEEGKGTVVISASGGTQSAFEASRYQNGYFTYALKEVIAEGRSIDDPYKRVWLNQLVKYVKLRVTEMSGGSQQPNLRISNPDLNWRIK